MSLPADISIRHSPRAKRAKLCVLRNGTVEVVVPPGFDLSKIPPFVQKHKAWIQQSQARLQLTRQTLSPAANDPIPQVLELRACGETWQIHYQATPSATLSLVTPPIAPHQPPILSVLGPIDSWELCRQALGQWLKQKAKVHLLAWLQHQSEVSQLPYQRAQIRMQKTRWGSCSSRKSINLNAKLLFLPPELVQYVLIHELCHTHHLNHSKQFWSLVAEKEPDYQRLDRTLNQAWAYVPQWLD